MPLIYLLGVTELRIVFAKIKSKKTYPHSLDTLGASYCELESDAESGR